MFPNLEAEMARNGHTNTLTAVKLGVSRQAFENKKKTGLFKLDEIRKLLNLYGQSFEYLFATQNTA